MTALRASFLVVALVMAIEAGPALAQTAQPQAADAAIVVTGEGSIDAAPDYAAISAGAVTRAKTAGDAAEANAKAMAAIVAALTDSGIARNDIQTTQFSLQPVYTVAQPGGEQRLTGFSVTNRVNVKIRDLGKAGAVLDKLVAAGATEIGTIQYLHSNSSGLLDQARQAAVADARRKAELYAKAAGVNLGAVVFIAENTGNVRPIFGKMLRDFAPAAAPTQVLTGEDTLSTQVTVGFAIAH